MGGRCFARATPPVWPGAVAGMLGRPVYPALGPAPAAPNAPAPADAAVTSPAAGSAGDLPFSLGARPPAPAARAAIKLGPPPPPITMSELHDLVSPAVVVLVASKANAAPQIAAGVLTTASGLILTSRRAIANALAGGGKLAVAHGGPRGHFGSRELADAVPARVLEVSDDLDLALVEALPAQAVFYPHLPVARRSMATGSALAVGHGQGKDRGLWSAILGTLAPPSHPAGTERWLRDVGAGIVPGTPLVDGVGRVVALVTEPQPGAARAIDAEALLRFLLLGQAPARRFAGVPPFRRPSTLITHAARLDPPAGSALAGVPSASLAGLVPANGSDQAMPGVSDKGSLDEHLKAAQARTARRPPALEKADVSAAGQLSFDGPANVLLVTASDLQRHPLPDVVKIDVDDAPERGARASWVTIVELGDYHAAETRLAEPTIRSLVDGDGAPARLLWKDADRGDGPAYLLGARAARAAGEQDDFWSMHDRLLEGKGAKMGRLEEARQLARELELDMQDFDAVMAGDGLASAVETAGEQAARIPALATPSFVVNGHVVDGGSVAGPALRAAVDEELALEAARGAKQPLDGVAAARCRGIADGKPVSGTAFEPASLAARVLAAAGRGEARARRSSRR